MPSPIEKLFTEALVRWAPNLAAITYEHKVDSYRIDFAIPTLMRGCELDGYTYHEGRGKEKATQDKQRERALDRAGWKLTRFSGSEIFSDADACAKEWLGICGVISLDSPRTPTPLSKQATEQAFFTNICGSDEALQEVARRAQVEYEVRADVLQYGGHYDARVELLNAKCRVLVDVLSEGWFDLQELVVRMCEDAPELFSTPYKAYRYVERFKELLEVKNHSEYGDYVDWVGPKRPLTPDAGTTTRDEELQ